MRLLNAKNNKILEPSSNNSYHRQLLMTEFCPTRMGRLMTSFLTTLYPTMIALFETEPTTEIHHRLLLNHINRHIDTMASRYHNHHQRRLLLIGSPRSARASAVAAVQQQSQLLRLNFRILIRLIGTLVQTDLLSANDLDIMTRQRIKFFFLTSNTTTTSKSDNETDDDDHHRPLKKKVKYQQQEPTVTTTVTFYESLKNNNTAHYCWQMCLEEIEFQMEIFLDLTRAILLLEQQSRTTTDLNMVSSMLDDAVSALISTRSNETTMSAATAAAATNAATTTV
jgi:hypothetical protein